MNYIYIYTWKKVGILAIGFRRQGTENAQKVPKNETAKTSTKSKENLAQMASVMHVLVAGFFEIK